MRRQARVVALSMLAFSPLMACSGSAAPSAGVHVAEADAAEATDATDVSGSNARAADEAAVPDRAAMTQNATPTTVPRNDPPPFAEVSRSAAPKGTTTSLLTGVRVKHGDGFERVVFEFAGSDRPGYQVAWMEDPVTAEGSGETAGIAGDSRLGVRFEPASGVDLETGHVTYRDQNRVDAPGDGSTIHEAVRTDDFEAVMTWVVGTDEISPFRVFTLSQPTRVMVDVAVPPAP